MKYLQATDKGSLYLVATPIGNLQDISLRAIDILKSVDLILAEDTRHSSVLLAALGIKNRLSAFHAHNEVTKSDALIELLLAGKSLALISDAGTPLISDPGFPLVQQARLHEIPVCPIPGPCALITALCAAGVPCDSFLFIGFLPAKSSARQAKLQSVSRLEHSLIFYESSHRIVACIEDIAAIFGVDCHLVLAKELTKAHERFIQGDVVTIKNWLLEDLKHQKGEFVLIIPPRPLSKDTQEQEETLKILLAQLPLKQAVAIASQLTKINKNNLYNRALELSAQYLQKNPGKGKR